MTEPDATPNANPDARAREILAEMETRASSLHAKIKAAPEAGAPGWLKPQAEDLCEQALTYVGEARAIGLPSVKAPRGVLTYPTMPDFGSLYAQAGFCYPASEYDRSETLDQARRLKDAAASLQALFSTLRGRES